MAKKRLGRGIDALLQGRPSSENDGQPKVLSIPLEQIIPNPEQPRKTFERQSLIDLSNSMAEKGVIQPILVDSLADGRYIIIAGERRYRAAKLANLPAIPAIKRITSSEERLELALIENIQREDLSPIEEAKALRMLMD